jgi:hypothetical protein
MATSSTPVSLIVSLPLMVGGLKLNLLVRLQLKSLPIGILIGVKRLGHSLCMTQLAIRNVFNPTKWSIVKFNNRTSSNVGFSFVCFDKLSRFPRPRVLFVSWTTVFLHQKIRRYHGTLKRSMRIG